jgi:hypothetical protein
LKGVVQAESPMARATGRPMRVKVFIEGNMAQPLSGGHCNDNNGLSARYHITCE